MSLYLAKLKSIIGSRDPKNKALIKRVNEEIFRAKAAAGVVHNNTTLSNLSLQYKNEGLIGLDLMPVIPQANKSDDYYIYSKRDRLEGPDDLMSKRARPNEINENRTTDTYKMRDYALMNYVDNETLREQDAPLDEKVDLVQSLNDVLALKREIRIANILTNGANFGGNTAALSGADRFDHASNVNLIQKIQAAKAALWTGYGASELVGFTSLDVLNVMAGHTAIRGLFQYQKDGLATADQIAKYFGLSKLLVGEARRDTANEGQTASYSRVWGNVFGIIRVAKNPSTRNATFGATFRLKGDPTTDYWFDPAVGKSGGWYARVGFSEDYKVMAPDTGFLYTTVIS